MLLPWSVLSRPGSSRRTRRTSASAKARKKRPRALGFQKLRVEWLEDRTLLATWFVDATQVSGTHAGTMADPFATIQDALGITDLQGAHVPGTGVVVAGDTVQIYGNNSNHVYVWTRDGAAYDNFQPQGNMLIPSGVTVRFIAQTLLEGGGGQPAPVIMKLANNIIDVAGNISGPIPVPGAELRVEGQANAVPGQPNFTVIFTSFLDDSVGGDTDNDHGVGLPSRNDWGGIRFRGGAVPQGATAATGSLINYADIRYTGEALFDPVSGGILTDGFASVRMEYDGTNAAPVRVENTIFRHGGRALDVQVHALADDANGLHGPVLGIDPANPFAPNTITFVDNAVNGMFINQIFKPFIPPVEFDMTWDNVGIPYVLTERLTIRGTHNSNDALIGPVHTLTINPGIVVKVRRNAIEVSSGGQLAINGTAAHPVIITSYEDDSVLNDTDNDGGTTAPVPGDWGGILLRGGNFNGVTGNPVPVSWNIDYAQIKYGGGQVPLQGAFVNQSPIDVSGSHTTSDVFRLSNSEVAFSLDPHELNPNAPSLPALHIALPLSPLDLPVANGQYTVIDNNFHHNHGLAIQTESDAYNDIPNPLGGYGVYFRRNTFTNNANNGVFSNTIGSGGFNTYLDNTDIVQTIGSKIQVTQPSQVVQLMSQRTVSASNGFLDTFNGDTSALNAFLAGLTFRGGVAGASLQAALGPFLTNPAIGDNTFFYHKVDFESTPRPYATGGTPIAGGSQANPTPLVGDEWRDLGVDVQPLGPNPLVLRSPNASDTDPLTPVSGNNVLTTSDPANSSFKLVFPDAVTAVGFWVIGNEVSTPGDRIDYYGIDNSIIGSVNLPTTPNPVFIANISREPIYRVVINKNVTDQVNGVREVIGIDDLYWVDAGQDLVIKYMSNAVATAGGFAGAYGPSSLGPTLRVLGQIANPVVQTSFQDDTIGAGPVSHVAMVTVPSSNVLTSTTPVTVNNLAVAKSVINVPNNINFTGILVNLNITYPNDSDLKIDLISPTNTDVTLINQRGPGGSNFINTTLDDSAAMPINAGTAPFTGSFQPEQPLSTFNGQTTQGNWTLEITDLSTNSFITGTLTSWTLTLLRPGVPGDWQGVQIGSGVNSSTIENVTEDQNGNIVRTPNSPDPYVIGDLGSNGLQDGTLVEHSDIRYATKGIDYQGYPNGKLSIEGNETEDASSSATANPVIPLYFNPSGNLAFQSYSGADRVGGSLPDFPGDPQPQDFYSLPPLPASIPPLTPIRLNAFVDHTGAAVDIWVFNHNKQLIYVNSGSVTSNFPLTKDNNNVVQIPDNTGVPATSSVTVTAQDFGNPAQTDGTIVSMTVTLNITQNPDSDLLIELVPPTATGLQPIRLADHRGGTGANFGTATQDTIFDDNGATLIRNGTAPFADPGGYVPDDPLRNFFGQNAIGTWTLRVTDTKGGDPNPAQNQINDFQIHFILRGNTQGVASKLGPITAYQGDVNYVLPPSTNPPPFIRDAQYIVVSGAGRHAHIFDNPGMGNSVLLTPIPGGSGFMFDIVNNQGKLVAIPSDDAFSGGGSFVGGYELEVNNADFHVLGVPAARPTTDGQVIFRQNLIRSSKTTGIYLHDLVFSNVGPGQPSPAAAQANEFIYPNSAINPDNNQPFTNPHDLLPGAEVYNNVIINGQGDGIQLTEDTSNPQPNTQVPTNYALILNNTIDNNAGTGINITSRGGPHIFNNLLTNNNIGANINDIGDIPSGTPDPDQTVLNYNLFFNNTTMDIQGTDFSGQNNTFGSDPQYVDPSQLDYRVQRLSPAIDAALSDLADRLQFLARSPALPTRAPNDDFRGFARVKDPLVQTTGAGAFPYYDIGAYEVNELPARVVGLSLFRPTGVVPGLIPQFTVTFSGRMDATTVTSTTVTISGGNVTTTVVPISNRYDPLTGLHTFTFQVQQPLATGDYVLTLAANPGFPGITDISGQLLDGEFNGQTFPSGEGVPGGSFIYAFHVDSNGPRVTAATIVSNTPGHKGTPADPLLITSYAQLQSSFTDGNASLGGPEGITLAFSKDIDPSSITPQNFRLDRSDLNLNFNGNFTTFDTTVKLIDPQHVRITLINPTTGQPMAFPPDVLENDLYRIYVNGIKDTIGVLFDGEFNGIFPSGDGTPGGVFELDFRVNLLFNDFKTPGDYTQVGVPGDTIGAGNINGSAKVIAVNTDGDGGADSFIVVNPLTGQVLARPMDANSGKYAGWFTPTDRTLFGDVFGTGRTDIIQLNIPAANQVPNAGAGFYRVLDPITNNVIKQVSYDDLIPGTTETYRQFYSGGLLDPYNQWFTGHFTQQKDLELLLFNRANIQRNVLALAVVDLATGKTTFTSLHDGNIFNGWTTPTDEYFIADVNNDGFDDFVTVNRVQDVASIENTDLGFIGVVSIHAIPGITPPGPYRGFYRFFAYNAGQGTFHGFDDIGDHTAGGHVIINGQRAPVITLINSNPENSSQAVFAVLRPLPITPGTPDGFSIFLAPLPDAASGGFFTPTNTFRMADFRGVGSDDLLAYNYPISQLNIGIFSTTMTNNGGALLIGAMGSQWADSGVGNAAAGVPDIGLLEAEAMSMRSANFTVASLDTGIDYTNRALAQNIWINQDEIPADVRARLADVDHDGTIDLADLQNPINQGPGKIIDVYHDGYISVRDLLAPRSKGGWATGLPDPVDGYVDDIVGWNFVDNNNNPYDDNGHGTFTAGILTHINPGVTIMPLKMLDSHGVGSTPQAIAALDYALAHGVKLSVNPWAPASYSQAWHDELVKAQAAGHLFVTAAGNSNPAIVATLSRLHLNNVLTVTASDGHDRLAPFANVGAGVVDLAAPGVGVVSTVPGGYAAHSGTSVSTAFVAGAASLVWGSQPSLTYRQVVDAILAGVDPLAGAPAGLGRLNIWGALVAAHHAASTGAAVSGIRALVPDPLTLETNPALLAALAQHEASSARTVPSGILANAQASSQDAGLALLAQTEEKRPLPQVVVDDPAARFARLLALSHMPPSLEQGKDWLSTLDADAEQALLKAVAKR